MEEIKAYTSPQKGQDPDEEFYDNLITPLLLLLEKGLNSMGSEEPLHDAVFDYQFVYCIQKLNIVLKWPPWTKYNSNAITQEEWDDRVTKRKKALNIFCSKGGIELFIRCMKYLDSQNKEGLVGHCLNLLIWCAYAPDEQRYLIEKGILLKCNLFVPSGFYCQFLACLSSQNIYVL